jgi:hypothetical protein
MWTYTFLGKKTANQPQENQPKLIVCGGNGPQASSLRLWSVSIWLWSEESIGGRVLLKLFAGGEEGSIGAQRERISGQRCDCPFEEAALYAVCFL